MEPGSLEVPLEQRHYNTEDGKLVVAAQRRGVQKACVVNEACVVSERPVSVAS